MDILHQKPFRGINPTALKRRDMDKPFKSQVITLRMKLLKSIRLHMEKGGRGG